MLLRHGHFIHNLRICQATILNTLIMSFMEGYSSIGIEYAVDMITALNFCSNHLGHHLNLYMLN